MTTHNDCNQLLCGINSQIHESGRQTDTTADMRTDGKIHTQTSKRTNKLPNKQHTNKHRYTHTHRQTEKYTHILTNRQTQTLPLDSVVLSLPHYSSSIPCRLIVAFSITGDSVLCSHVRYQGTWVGSRIVGVRER